jgi:5-methylcytosine-specific restriction endonuclease McrA
MKQEVLKLNKNYLPIGTDSWKKIITDIVSGAAFPIDVHYDEHEDGVVNREKITYINVIKDFEEWSTLPIRPYDEKVTTPKIEIRMPTIVICSHFDKIITKMALFPTKTNIWKRDDFYCGYTGEKLTKEQLSVDHILPKSRGGQNTWENLITASKDINRFKDDRTPEEAGLKLLWKPTKPLHGKAFGFLRKEWEMFLDGGNYNND